MSVKLNLHSHSVASHDGTITIEQLEQVFAGGVLDQVAITDHNEIKYAQKAEQSLGKDRIIVGQEVTTKGGKHIIGLFLSRFVTKGLPVERTCELIRAQGGLVYIPHPFEPGTGVGREILAELVSQNLVDIIEGFNSWNYWGPISPRASAKQNLKAREFAEMHKIPVASASDSHTVDTLKNAYVVLPEPATRENLIELLSNGEVEEQHRKFNWISFNAFKAAIKSIKSRFKRS